ncbi:MAG: formylmethanofuran dehydrogenase subunit C [Betaproteobacteria bacterium]|nr:formylmethanofuran dehydrogenase subunit C [Betaproteobacteria bacterium]MCH9848686.1 formylmethanofuran dehydrogenase subunit C [Betaproteobacteria bacterium]
MSALIFTVKASVSRVIDCKKLTPDYLQGKSIAAISSIALGSQTVADVFDVQGDDATTLVFKNTTPQLHYIGYRMKTGSITIEGDVGDFTGAEMQGGVLICKGNTGKRTGDTMRRGLLLIEGNTGDYCASNMRAGTLGLLGSTGAYLGYGMQRGTLLLSQNPAEQATWLDCGLHTLPFLNMLYQSFQILDTKFTQLSNRRVRRWMGDVSGLGKAEILVLQT